MYKKSKAGEKKKRQTKKHRDPTKANKGNKSKSNNIKNDVNSEQIEDIMAWGKSKNNYYQQQQNQYSQASQQQDQAKQIYENQYQNDNMNLNQQQFYQIPQHYQDEDQAQEQEQDDDNQLQLHNKQEQNNNKFSLNKNKINPQYLKKQLLWTAQIAKVLQGIKDNKYQFRKNVYDSYLLLLMALKEYQIPYIREHPIMQNLGILKKMLQQFEKEIPNLYQNIYGQNQMDKTQQQVEQQQNQQQEIQDQVQQQQQLEQEQQDEFQQSGEQCEQQKQLENTTKYSSKSKLIPNRKQINEGLELYNRLKSQKKMQRSLKKSQNKTKYIQKQPKQAFRLISEKQGQVRLANEKIIKNKGLMKRKRKDDGNSRVKLRHKYQKALVRRKAKGYVGVREDPGRFYAGQQKVLYGKIASTKLQ